MHDIKFFEENIESVKSNLIKRKFDTASVDVAIELNSSRKNLLNVVETRRADIKKISKEVGMLKREGKDATELMSEVANIKSEIQDKEVQLASTELKIKEALSVIPNLIDDSVPVGETEDDNLEVTKWGTPREFKFEPTDHADLGESLGLLDFERGAKLTGARFVVYKGLLAKMERALINYMLDKHSDNSYEEILPPFIVNSDSMYGTGQLPKFAEDAFKLDLENKDWYLIPTAEVPVTNLRRGELFSGSELPLKYCAYTPCFRSEAGSHGKDTKGLIRVHQFNKVEMVCITSPEESEKTHQEMVNTACNILQELKLPYRNVLLCTGDIGFGAKKCYDLEVWLPAQKRYREISSISNCGDFQARRANIRFRGDDKKPQFPHTLNGSGLAVGRTLVAIMENYQLEDGSIEVPEVLRPYMRGIEKISKK